jgi:hypothetical protein
VFEYFDGHVCYYMFCTQCIVLLFEYDVIFHSKVTTHDKKVHS